MAENTPPKAEQINQDSIKCKQCGAKLEFAPGTSSLKCPYCGAENEIKIDEEKRREALREIDYFSFISDSSNIEVEQEEESFVKCPSCGAETTIAGNAISAECPFCGTPLVKDQAQIKSLLKPSALIPFIIDKKTAVESFNKWMKKSFWAPKKAKVYARPDKLQGIYTPYWTFDARTITSYTGQRGDDYEETRTDSDGNTTTVTKTRWHSVSGTVYVNFDDIMIVASNSLPEKYVNALEPWHLTELVPFNKSYLSGLKSESYEVDVKQGFEKAKIRMENEIEQEIRRDIGGDHQRIMSKNIQYNNVTFKHILLPIWVSSYRFKGKVYNFVVNGQTGKVKGKRPVDAMKVILVILLVIVIIALIAYFSQQ